MLNLSASGAIVRSTGADWGIFDAYHRQFAPLDGGGANAIALSKMWDITSHRLTTGHVRARIKMCNTNSL